MSTGLSLFGGLAAVVLLFMLARLFKASAELAGIIAGGLPLLVYLVSLFGGWPGLDVLAIHIAVYLVAAYVLLVFARYRAKQQKMHWVPKLLIAFFILLAVINASLLHIATSGLPPSLAGLFLPGASGETVHTGFSGTTRHGQEAAKSVSADLSRQHQNQSLGWQIRLEGLRQPSVGENGLYISAEDRESRVIADLTGFVRVSRLGTAGVDTPVHAVAPGQYEARIALPGEGLWIVELELRRQDAVWKQVWEISVANGAARQ